jgi:hypothetical protein
MWWTAYAISGFVCDSRYISIPTSEAYSHFYLSNYPSISAPISAVVAGVSYLLMSSIPATLSTFDINPICVKRKELVFCFSIRVPRNSPNYPSSLN